MIRSNQPHRQAVRRDAAEARQAVRNQRTPEEQIAVLNARGITECREIERLQALINRNNEKKEA